MLRAMVSMYDRVCQLTLFVRGFVGLFEPHRVV